MRRAGTLAALVLTAACQPQARRLLLLDLTLADPIALTGTARPWHDAGYAIEYRQFYPHLARRDLERYRTVVLLGGREPEGASDALTVGDLILLHEWVSRGGVVVLGYEGDGEGYLDRWLLNRWLELEGAGIAIGDRLLEDTSARPSPQPSEAWVESRRLGDEPLGSVFDPFPLARNHVVSVRDRTELLASAGRHAFVRAAKTPSPRPDAGVAAAARIGDGLAIVISRSALGALAPRDRAPPTPVLTAGGAGVATRAFLTALARWTRRPAEWAHVPPAGRGAPLMLAAAPAPVEWQPPPVNAPPDAGVTALPLEPDPALARAAGTPVWVRRQGIRALWTPLFATREGRPAPRTAAALDSLVAFLDAAAVNLLAGDAGPWAIADSAHVPWEARDTRRAWSDLATRLQPTSVAWIPALDYRDGRVSIADSSRGPRGEGLADWCALDSLFWGQVTPAFAALGRLAAEQRDLVLAVGLDLHDEAHSAAGEFCDAAWHHTLARLGRGALDSLPIAERYRALREQGLLAAYDRALEDEVAARAGALRDRALRQRSNLLFAFRLGRTPSDWFSLGVLRGFALSDRPVLLLGQDVRVHDLLPLYRARGVNAVHAAELAPALLSPRDWTGLRRVVFEQNDGFWLDGAETGVVGGRAGARPAPDSLARLVRRLTR